MRALGDYLDLTVEQARAQWGQILRRTPRPRQEAFTPVEAVLCYGLFFVVDPHKYGGSSMHRAPAIVHDLAALFVRPPGSVISKMMNLDGSRTNAAAQEWRFFVELATDVDRFPHLYNVVLLAARDMGVSPGALPDFLLIEGIDELDLLGQEELSPRTLKTVIDVKAAKRRIDLLASEADTMRLVEQAVRLGQHRFAGAVLSNYEHTCAFCGFAPRSLPANGLLVASHIKPWAVSDDRERLDPSNGVAACPTHDAAFDAGLLTVNGGLRVHSSPPLQASYRTDPGVGLFFGDALQPTLLVPEGGSAPSAAYLEWHHENIYQGELG
ncbi:MAG: HNH endonuclease [Acidimicrobiales bacterium]